MTGSYVVTGGGRGIGRAVTGRLLAGGATVVLIEADPAALAWTADHPAAARLRTVTGDAAAEQVTAAAVDLAEAAAPLAGWVNNAAVFRDASVHTARCRVRPARHPGERGGAGLHHHRAV